MARVTEASVDGRTRRRARDQRPTLPDIGTPVRAAATSSVACVALIVGGAGAILAPAPLPFPGDVLAIGAVAVGGWLMAHRPAVADPNEYVDRLTRATFAERQEVIRAALAVASLSGSDVAAERAHGARAVAAAIQPRAAGDDDRPAGRPDLRAVEPTRASDESLDPGADAAALSGSL